MNLLYKEAGKYRLEFSRIIKNGTPFLRVVDNYGYPLVVNEYLFEYKGAKELNGYGAKMIDDILEIISLASKTATGKIDFITKKSVGDMGLLNRALEDVQFAMEELDDTTGSKSGFMFHTEPKMGEVLTIITQQYNDKVFQQKQNFMKRDELRENIRCGLFDEQDTDSIMNDVDKYTSAILQDLQEHLQRDVKLSFLKQKDVDRINWYIDTYFKQQNV